MRFNIPLCLSFLGALVSFSSVSARATYSHQLQLAERDAGLISMRDAGLLDLRDDDFLEIRDEDLDMRDDGLLDIRDVEDLYEMLVRRAKITAAAQATRKAAAAAAANSKGKAPHATTAKSKGNKAVSRPKTASQVDADARKAVKKQEGRHKFGAAAAAHRATTNLPETHDVFKVPNSRGPAGKKKGPTFTGKEVKKAVFDSHMEREANKSKSNRQRRLSPLKNFGNSDHRAPHAHHPNDVKSINHMTGAGHEFPIGDPVNKGPARVITQKTKSGHTTFKGVVAHDVGRTPGSTGYNDHFQVKPTRH